MGQYCKRAGLTGSLRVRTGVKTVGVAVPGHPSFFFECKGIRMRLQNFVFAAEIATRLTNPLCSNEPEEFVLPGIGDLVQRVCAYR